MNMPTINEVWEQALQINANLATIHDDLSDLGECCEVTNTRINNLINRTDETNDWLEELRHIINHGFTTLSAGVSGVHARQDLTNRLLMFQVQQQATIICVLEKISENTCNLLNESGQQTDFQETLVDLTEGVNHMFATTNPDAALTYRRALEERQRVEACCPTEQPEPDCYYEPCEEPVIPKVGTPEKFEGYESQPSQVDRIEKNATD
jgi:hypothetical protein